MITFTTESGSVYMIDAEGKRIRQIKGSSTRHGGEWFEYIELLVTPGQKALVLCPHDRMVWTSRVVQVTPCLN